MNRSAKNSNTDNVSSHTTVSSSHHGAPRSKLINTHIADTSYQAAQGNSDSSSHVHQTVSGGHALHFSNMTYSQGGATASNTAHQRPVVTHTQSHTVSHNQSTGMSHDERTSDPSLQGVASSTTSQKTRTAQPPQDLNFTWQRYCAMNKSAEQGWANLHKPQSRAPLTSQLPSQILFSNEQGVSHVAHISPMSPHANQVQGVPNTSYSAHQSGARSAPEQGVANTGSGIQGVKKTSYSAANTPDEIFDSEGGIGRKSGQTSVRMGVSSVQRKVAEHERNKSEVIIYGTI